MELVHIPREEPLPPKLPSGSLPPNRWYSKTDLKLENKVPELNIRLAQIWNTYKQGKDYIAKEAQNFHASNGMNVGQAGMLLFVEQLSTGTKIATGVAISALLGLEAYLGVRWVLNWVGRKMAEQDEEEEEQRLPRRVHARSWTPI